MFLIYLLVNGPIAAHRINAPFNCVNFHDAFSCLIFSEFVCFSFFLYKSLAATAFSLSLSMHLFGFAFVWRLLKSLLDGRVQRLLPRL